jgi:hypothetical protein
MTLGTSLLLIAVGAVLRFAVTAQISGVELATVGTILIVVGIVGLVLSLIFLLQRDRGRGDRDRVVERDVVERDRR